MVREAIPAPGTQAAGGVQATERLQLVGAKACTFQPEEAGDGASESWVRHERSSAEEK